MAKLSLRIEVVRSHFKHISSMSERSAGDIVAALQQHYTDVIMTNVDTLADMKSLVARKPDLVFAGIYHIQDEAQNGAKVWLADMLEQNGIAYTGSGKLANRLSLNKHLAKQRMVEQGIRTAPFLLAAYGDDTPVNEGALTFPLFVKPSDKNGRQGIDDFSVVHTTQQLQNKVNSIHKEDHTDALIEEYLSGREFSVAIIGELNDTVKAMPFELVAAADKNGDRIRSHILQTSDPDDMKEITNPLEKSMLETFAIDAFRALGGTGYGRIDVRFNALGIPFFLEANSIPSLIKTDSSFLKAYEATFNAGYESMIVHIAQLALRRKHIAGSRQEFLPIL